MKYFRVVFAFLCVTVFVAGGCAKHSLEREPSSSNNRLLIPDPSASDQILPKIRPALIIPLEPARAPGAAAYGESSDNDSGIFKDAVAVVYDRVVLTEDTILRGNVLIKGYLVVAPQATLRIEPGTTIRFAGVSTGNNAARLVVQGRIIAVGTVESPIVITSDRNRPARGDWGGISLVSSEKRNQLEHCRIEYANSAIEAQFSTVSLKMVAISRSHTGFMMRDTVAQMAGGSISESETGIEMHDSEFDSGDVIVSDCKRGIVMNRSAVSVSSMQIRNNQQYGILSDDCRIRVASAELSGNGTGASFKGGEGQILATSFHDHRETALFLSGARIKVNRCRFFNNGKDALRLEDGRALLWGNAFEANKGFNLYNAGRDDISALLNWWGSSDISAVSQKIHDAVRDPSSGSVHVFPWLKENPAFLR
ncbi:MAG: right-handed parallel beta-helix repeat-containing protein [Geobacteraceae bacterium]|nr:right-handed parallel beta-helix repeat-containing protein [Geobacteraceae bacterium]